MEYFAALDQRETFFGSTATLTGVPLHSPQKTRETPTVALRNSLRNAPSKSGFIRILTSECRNRFQYDAFSLSSYEPATGVLLPIYAEDTPLRASAPEQVRCNLIVRRNLTEEPRLINRAAEDTTHSLDPFGDESRLSRSLMFCPLVWNGQIVGMLSVQSYTPGKYAPEDLRDLAEIARETSASMVRLRLSERQRSLSRALEQSASMVIVTDSSGRIEYVNKQFLDTTGYSEQEVLGRQPRFLKSGKTPPETYAGLWETILNGGVWRGEFQNRRRDGSLYWVSSTISPIVDEDGDHTHFIAVQEDITDRRRQLEETRRRDDILRAVSSSAAELLRGRRWDRSIQPVLHTLGTAVGVDRVSICRNIPADKGGVSPERIFEWLAPGIEPTTRLTGRARSYAEMGFGRWARQFEDDQIVVGAIDQFPPQERDALAQNGVRSLLAIPIRVAGAWWGCLSFDDCSNPRIWSEAEIEALKTAANVLSASIEADFKERALEESEETSRALLDASPLMSVLLDIDGRILNINEEYAKRLGQSVEELLAKNLYEILPPEVTRIRLRNALKAVDTAEPVRFTDETRDGAICDSVVYPVIDCGGRVHRLAFYTQDVTAIRRNERLAALGLTASGLAHYIKNIQTTLTISQDLLDRKIQNEEYAVVKQVWPAVRRSMIRINKLVKDMLALAREAPLQLQPTSLNDLLTTIGEECERRALELNAQLALELEEDLPPVLADPTRLHDALLNLVGNALDALQGLSGGQVALRTEAAPGRREVLVIIEDNGPGIPEEIRDRLFEPFSTTKGAHGTGLGLAVVRRIVEQHKARIDVESEIGEGARFTLTIPAAPQPDQVPDYQTVARD